MVLKKIELKNKGMSQDLSISKEIQEYAFKNKNIRIQALEDSTLISITNIKGPKKIETEANIEGKLLGKCKCNSHLVLFTQKGNTPREYVDCIYRIDFTQPIKVNKLFEGNLNFNNSAFIDSVFYYENLNVQKVYFVDGINKPRFINIMKTYEEANDMEFYPIISSTPHIVVEKDYSINSQLPAGTIQYFISYYNKNGAETLIANASSVNMIDHLYRGAKADETGMCGFKLVLSNLDKSFDCVRIYSAIRTSQEGTLLVKIVGDYDIRETNGVVNDITILDGGINQETIEDSMLYFIGGTPFIAKTISQKDKTAFFGNLTIKDSVIPNDIKTLFEEMWINHEQEEEDEHYWADTIDFFRQGFNDSIIERDENGNIISVNFDKREENINNGVYKNFSLIPTDYNDSYKYRRQTIGSSLTYKTFKGGEIYRFGIQFQNGEGQWTPVLWIGDKKCESYPKFDDKTHVLYLNNASFKMPDHVKSLAKAAGYTNYRIVFADPENQNGRSILAQGIVCPTLFTPGQRGLNAPYSLSSWIMRPREGSVAYHHFEPLFAAEEDKGGELWSYQLGDTTFTDDEGDTYIPYTHPYKFKEAHEDKDAMSINVPEYLVTFFSIDTTLVCARTVKFRSNRGDYNFDDVEGLLDKNGNPIDGSAYDANKNYAELVFDKYYDAGTYSKMKKKGIKEVRDEMADAFVSQGLDPTAIPSLSALQTLIDNMHQQKVHLIWGWVVVIAAIIASICIAVATWGAAAPASAVAITAACGLAATLAVGGTLGGILQSGNYPDKAYGLTQEDLQKAYEQVQGLESWQKEFLLNSYFAYAEGTGIDIFANKSVATSSKMVVENMKTFNGAIFQPKNFPLINTGSHNYAKHFVSITQVPHIADYDALRNEQMNDYYVDESIVSFYTPNVEELNLDGKTSKFRIVGIAPIDNNYADFDLQVSYPYLANESMLKDPVLGYRSGTDLFVSDYLYLGPSWWTDGGNTPDEEHPNYLMTNYAKYKVFMLDKTGSLVGADGDTQTKDESVTLTGIPDITKDKMFYNHQFSYGSIYLDNEDDRISYNPSILKLFTGDIDGVQVDPTKPNLYYGNYSNLINTIKTNSSGLKNFHKLLSSDEVITSPLIQSQVDIKYKSDSHLVFDLNGESSALKYLLPYFSSREIYEGLSSRKEKLNGGWSRGNEVPSDTIDCWTNDSNLYYEDTYFFVIPSKVSKNPGHREFLYDDYIYDTRQKVICGPDVQAKLELEKLKNRQTEVQSRGLTELTEVSDLRDQSAQLARERDAAYAQGNNYPVGSEERNYYNKLAEDYNTNSAALSTEADILVEDIVALNAEYNQLSQEIAALIPATKIPAAYSVETFLNYFLPYSDKLQIYNFLLAGKTATLGVKTGINPTNNPAIISDIISNIPNNTHYCKLRITSATIENNTISNLVYEEYIDDDEIFIIKNNKPNRWIFTSEYGLSRYKDFPIRYIAPTINQDITLVHNNVTAPYLFIGELYKDIKHKDLYGGFDNNQIENLIWLPASPVTPIDEDVKQMEGDTFFQRWDCLKTYPYTEEDFENKIVDITSFMVESHFNLDERTDSNRATFNRMVRPTNFNLWNHVYDFKNNIFTYLTQQSDLVSTKYPNQFTWSLAKNYLADVDSWTGVTVASVGECSYPITKIENPHNNLIALTEHSLELINFNAKNLIAGEDGSFIELANSAKVDGTIKMSYPYGTYNASVKVTEKGMYFIDDNTKSLMLLGNESLVKVGDIQMDSWFKKNIVQGTFTYNNQTPFHLEYDGIHKDLYIINANHCLIYNEKLNAFTSFIDFEDTYTLFDFGGTIYSVALVNTPKIYEMFGGDYNTSYEGKMIDYYMQYRINPEPISDKVFTNIEFVADCSVNDENTHKSSTRPFNYIRAWNEYQDTEDTPLSFVKDYVSNLKQKFRIWRADIPRDANSPYKRDRIRNPWIHLALGRKNDDGCKEKMEMHSLQVQYME